MSPFIVGIGGTTRANSSSERALKVALRAATTHGAKTLLIGGSCLHVPHYDPGSADRTDAARALLNAFRQCDGLIIASPAYHGAISGVLKNALDYAEDLRSDPRPYFDGVPIGCIACGAGAQAAVLTLGCLRTIAHALRGWPTPLGVSLNTTQIKFDDDEGCSDPATEQQLHTLAEQVYRFANDRLKRTTEA
jgi:FMN reductase